MVGTSSTAASSAASWHSSIASSSEKQGELPPPEPTAGMCPPYWDDTLFSGGWGEAAAPQGLQTGQAQAAPQAQASAAQGSWRSTSRS